MPVSAYLYPWDVDGDPAAADRIAGLGVTEVSLAAAYHAVRAVTPFHPGHRVVTRDAAVYYRPDPARWRGAALRPADAGDGHAGSFERAAGALHTAGLRVNAWVVVAHNGYLGAAHPECAVRNAYGDVYPWALCIGSPEVAGYAATLSAEIAALSCVDAVELEACGWYGYDHGSAHDKTGGTAPDGTSAWLLDACFCPGCCARTAQRRPRPGRPGANSAGRARRRVPVAAGPARDGPADEAAQDGRPVDGTPAAGHLARASGSGRVVRRGARRHRRVLPAPGPEPPCGTRRPATTCSCTPTRTRPKPESNPGYDPAVLLGPDGADGMILACPARRTRPPRW